MSAGPHAHVIHTPRLCLTPLRQADAPALHALWTAAAVRRYLWDGRALSFEQTAQIVGGSELLFAERGLGLWAARLPDAEVLLGFAGFWFMHGDADLELVYGLDPACWRQGYATELARAMLRHGFGDCALREIRASTDAANLASVRVLRRLGFLPERSQGGSGRLQFRLPRGVHQGADWAAGAEGA